MPTLSLANGKGKVLLNQNSLESPQGMLIRYGKPVKELLDMTSGSNLTFIMCFIHMSSFVLMENPLCRQHVRYPDVAISRYSNKLKNSQLKGLDKIGNHHNEKILSL